MTLAQGLGGINRRRSDRDPELEQAPLHLRDRGLAEVEDRGGEGGLGVSPLGPVRERPGEILGFAGLVGAGRSEMAKAMVGLDAHGGGRLTLAGETVSIRHARDAKAKGIYLVPEDRRAEGLIVRMSVRENVTLPSLNRYASALRLINRARERQIADEQIASLAIKTPGPEALVVNLSGGNQQKVVIGKWLELLPRVLLLDEPTRGVDIGAKAEIYRLIEELTARGHAVVLASSDLPEVIRLADRVLCRPECLCA